MDVRKEGREASRGTDSRITCLNRIMPRITQTLGRNKGASMSTKRGIANLLYGLPSIYIHPPAISSTRTEVFLFHSHFAKPQQNTHHTGCWLLGMGIASWANEMIHWARVLAPESVT